VQHRSWIAGLGRTRQRLAEIVKATSDANPPEEDW
jgi:hypothetical protein